MDYQAASPWNNFEIIPFVNVADLDGDGHISSVDITVLYNIMLGN